MFLNLKNKGSDEIRENVFDSYNNPTTLLHQRQFNLPYNSKSRSKINGSLKKVKQAESVSLVTNREVSTTARNNDSYCDYSSDMASFNQEKSLLSQRSMSVIQKMQASKILDLQYSNNFKSKDKINLIEKLSRVKRLEQFESVITKGGKKKSSQYEDQLFDPSSYRSQNNSQLLNVRSTSQLDEQNSQQSSQILKTDADFKISPGKLVLPEVKIPQNRVHKYMSSMATQRIGRSVDQRAQEAFQSIPSSQPYQNKNKYPVLSRNSPSLIFSDRGDRSKSLLRGESNINLIQSFIEQGAHQDRSSLNFQHNVTQPIQYVSIMDESDQAEEAVSVIENKSPLIAPISLGQRKIIADTHHQYYSNQFTRNHEQQYQQRSMPIKKKKEDPWSAERQSTFPIKKLDIVKKIKLTEANEIRRQIDQVIDNPPKANYTYEQSLFRYMDRAVNFEGRLSKIDDILNKGCFDGTWDLVKPSYKYVKDPILEKGIKKRKFLNINDDLIKSRICHIKYTHDHQGMIVTMNGSKYENWQHMKEIHERRDQENKILLKKSSSKIETGTFNDQSLSQSEPSSQQNSRGGLKRVKSKQTELAPAFEVKKQFIKQKSNSILDSLTLFFTDKLRRLFAQDTCMRLLKKFRRELQRNLDAPDGIMDEIRQRAVQGDDQIDDSDSEDDELVKMISKLPDEEFEKRLISSQYDGEFKKLVSQARETEMDQKLMGSITGNTEINIKTAIRKDISLSKKLQSVKDKLNFVYQISKAHEALDKILVPKSIKRWKLDSIGEERLTKVFKSIKDEFNQIHDQISRKREIVFDPESYSVSLDQALLMFHEQCSKYNVVPPMLKKKIEENMILEISNYKVNDGLCQALGAVANKFFPDHIETLVLEDNSLEDETFSVLLKSLYQAKRIKGLYIMKNSIGSKSQKILQSLIEKQYPFHIDELVLTGSKLCQGGLSQILWSCKAELQIKSLGLSQLEFDDQSLKELISLVQKSQSLEILDLSYCHFHITKALPTFLTQAANSNTLQYLNLSFNPNQDSKAFADALKLFLSSSSSLLTHLNLSGCNIIQPEHVLSIFEGVKKSKTLQSIHFSGNHFDSNGIIGDKVRIMLGVWKVQAGQNSEQGIFTQNEEKNTQRKVMNYGTKLYHKNTQRKQLNAKIHRNQDLDYQREEEFILAGDSVVFSRVLGRLEIIKGYQWVQRDQCWICGNWQYVILIWSQVAGDNYYETIQQKKYLDQLKTQPLIDPDRIEPIVFPPPYRGKETLPQSMLSMGEFMTRIEQNFKPHSRLVIQKEERKRIQELQNQITLRSQSKLNFKNVLKTNNQSHQSQNYLLNQIKLQEQEEWREIFRENKKWPLTLERLLFAPDRLICRPITTEDIQSLKPKPDELFFVHADYYPPTKQKAAPFTVFGPNIDSMHVYCKQIHINQRDKLKQHLTTMKKRTKKTRIDRNFNLKQSVFGHWAININAEYRKMFEADMQYSKIKKFIKEGKEFTEISNYLLSNYGKIYEVYLYCSGQSNYPSIQWIDFTDMCSSSWKIIDKNLTLATVDRLFIAVNFEGVPGGLDDNPDKELCRYEFFEIMVRMAIAKFPTLAQHEALSKMLDQYVLVDPETLSWWQYRQELMWTLEVDDLMKANQTNIRKLYQSVQTVLKKTYTSEDAVNMIQNCPGLKLSEKETTLAFAYSKFLVKDEMTEIDNMFLLNFGEFNEFIARLSQIRYGDPKMPLQDKVYKTMIELFKFIGVTPSLPLTNNIGDSESDYDDFKEEDDRATKIN